MARHLDRTPTDSTTVIDEDEGAILRYSDHTADETQAIRATHGADDAPDGAVGPPAARREAARRTGPAAAQERFGGINWGASVLGWVLTAAVAGLLAVAAVTVAAVLGATSRVTEAESALDTSVLVAAGVLLAVLLVGYYTGGYAAGRMSRFDGARQGVGVWAVGLLVAVVVTALGLLVGRRSGVLDRLDVPAVASAVDRMPASQQLWVGVTAVVVVLLGTMLVAMLGGSVGRRYHERVDRVVGAA
jgi:hypothetical protein